MDALLLVDKPQGYSSQDVLTAIKRAVRRAAGSAVGSAGENAGEIADAPGENILGKFKLEKIGHAGTLDPLGTGLLVVLLNGATSLQEFFLSDVKEYQGTFKLGLRTTSDDIDGEITEEFPTAQLEKIYASLTPEKLRELATKFTGTLMQHPPAVSAVHVNGERSYKIARRRQSERQDEKESAGQHANPLVELPAARAITVFELSLTVIEQGADRRAVAYTAKVSKGTYIRSLARDLGEFLGCGAVVESLRRTRSGGLSVANAASCAIVDGAARLGLKEGSLTPIGAAVGSLPEVWLSQEECRRVLNGERAPLHQLVPSLASLSAGGWAKVLTGGAECGDPQEMLSFLVQKTDRGVYSDGNPLQIRYRAR